MRCFVFGCNSGSQSSKTHMFKAPKKANRELWLQNIPKRAISFDFNKSKICHLHFDEEFIVKSRTFVIINGERVENLCRPTWTLMPNAVPTIFENEKLLEAGDAFNNNSEQLMVNRKTRGNKFASYSPASHISKSKQRKQVAQTIINEKAPKAADKPQWAAKIPKREIPFDFRKSKLCYLHFDEGFIIKNNEYIVINGEKVKNPASVRWTLKPTAIPTKFTKEQLTTWHNLPKNKRKSPSKREFTEIYQKLSDSGSKSESSSKPKRKKGQGVSVIKSSVPEPEPVQEDEPSNQEPEGPSSPEPEPILDNLDTPIQEDEDPTPVKLSLNSELIQLPSNQWVVQNKELDNCIQMIFHEIAQITDCSNFKGFSLQKSLIVTDSGEIQYFSSGEDITQKLFFLQTKIDKIEDLNSLLISFHNTEINFENRQPAKSLSEFDPGDEDADLTFDESELPPASPSVLSHTDDDCIVETNTATETASNQDKSSQQESSEDALKKKFKVRDLSVKAIKLALPTKKKSVSLIVKRLPSKIVKEQQIFQPIKKAKIIPSESVPKCSSLVQEENVDNDNSPAPAEEVPKSRANLKCSICEEEFLFYREYAKHTRNAHRAKTLLCELCGVDINVNNYVSHVRSHTPKGERAWQKKEAHLDSTYEFECKICGDGKRFRTQRFLNYHCSMTHTVFVKQPIQLEIFKCKHCTKTFMLEQSLEQHERGHFDKAFIVDLLG